MAGLYRSVMEFTGMRTILTVAVLLLLCALAHAAAQTTQNVLPKIGEVGHKEERGGVGPFPLDNKSVAQPLQADQFLFDTRNNRVVAQGQVEFYYKNSSLFAERVIYDRSANELVAEGDVQLKNPDGSITRGDRLRLTDEYRDAFHKAIEEIGHWEDIAKRAKVK
jgi:lipopolysaccharide assembly outer membrane protein LptD (OstA)